MHLLCPATANHIIYGTEKILNKPGVNTYGNTDKTSLSPLLFYTSTEAGNDIGLIERLLSVSWCLVADIKFGTLRAVRDWTEELPLELIPSATRIIIKVKTIPISEGRKSIIIYCELFPEAYAAIMEIKATEYTAPDSTIITMTGKRVECMRYCFSCR